MITRIRELLEARQLSPTQFADLIGVGRPVISHILSERNKPSLEVVQKIIGAFPDISLPWLLAGTGPMLAPNTSPSQELLQVPRVASPPLAMAAAPSSLPTPPSAPLASSATPTRQAAPRPGSYAQPLRFRPGTTATVSPARVAASPPPVEELAPSATAATVSALPSFNSVPTATTATPVVPPATGSALVTPAQAPSLPKPALPAPPSIANETLGADSSPTAPVAEVSAPSTNLETSASFPNPAAALSFLGEPGKAIRRIVIFYRDGSFSDYLPEGN